MSFFDTAKHEAEPKLRSLIGMDSLTSVTSDTENINDCNTGMEKAIP